MSTILVKDQWVDEETVQQLEVASEGRQRIPHDHKPRMEDIFMEDTNTGHFLSRD